MKSSQTNAMETDELPKIHLPGEEKFQSYKNSLQDFCHKKKFSAPQYVAEKEDDGLVGTVRFSSSYVKCKEKSGNMKEADSRAAFEALKQLGYLKGKKFEQQRNQLKRKGDNIETNAKQIKPGTIIPVTSKGQLNQIAQKNKWEAPTYNTVSVPGGHFSTVTIENTQFKSTSIHKKKTDAEQDAAQVALNAMASPLPQTPNIPTVKATPGISVKNRLQQYCQKSSKELPRYETKRNEAEKTYQSMVTVDGVEYCGVPQLGKKAAESAAAEVVLMGLMRKGFIV